MVSPGSTALFLIFVPYWFLFPPHLPNTGWDFPFWTGLLRASSMLEYGECPKYSTQHSGKPANSPGFMARLVHFEHSPAD